MLRKILFSCLMPASMLLIGCYTVVMIPGRTHHRVHNDAVVYDEYYEDMEQSDDAQRVIHEHYLYGDLWPGGVYFDPYWTSSYWWYYPTWSRLSWRRYMWSMNWWDPWWDTWIYHGYYSPWYGFGYGYGYPYYYGYGGYGGYGYGYRYYDPYWYYYGSYYSSAPQKQRPFGRRTALHRVDDNGDDAGSVVTRRLGSDASAGSDRRVRRETASENTPVTRTVPSSATSTRRVRSTSGTIRQPASSSRSSTGASSSRRVRSGSSGSSSSSRRGGGSSVSSSSGSSSGSSSSGSSSRSSGSSSSSRSSGSGRREKK